MSLTESITLITIIINQSSHSIQPFKHHTTNMAPFPSPTSTWHDNTYPTLSPNRPELSAKGKTIIITGGGTGIGAETARHFAQAGAARIGLIGRREQPLLDTQSSIQQQYPGIEIIIASTDVTKKTEVDAAFAKIVGDGKLHVVVSNAASMGPREGIKDVNGEELLEGVQMNLSGALWVAQAFLRYAVADAVAINVSSSAAHISFGDVFASYSVAKLAAYRLWDMVGLKHPEMSVFHIQPGVVNTDINKEAGGVAALGFEDHGKCILSLYSTWGY
jgi:NAD(P)-dependent dehydrogenase (short-subunit alcohol dehydrogenase family)